MEPEKSSVLCRETSVPPLILFTAGTVTVSANETVGHVRTVVSDSYGGVCLHNPSICEALAE